MPKDHRHEWTKKVAEENDKGQIEVVDRRCECGIYESEYSRLTMHQHSGRARDLN